MTSAATSSPARRPEPRPFPTCHLPAVGGWAVYDYAEGKPRWVEAHPHCRFHEQTERAKARRAAEKTGPKASVYPCTYQPGSRVTCRGERNPEQLGEVLDRERILAAGEKIRDGLAELAHLTANGWGASFRIGNEPAVLLELLKVADVVEEWVGVVARRTASRSNWDDVAEVLNREPLNPPRPRNAVQAWQAWGGGPGDEDPPATPQDGDRCACGHTFISHGTVDRHCTMCNVNGVFGCKTFRPEASARVLPDA